MPAPSRIRKGAQVYVPIKEWMDHLGVNDERMAERLGLSNRSAFWKIRKEQHRLDLARIQQIAEAMGIHWKRLLTYPERDSVDALIEKLPQKEQDRIVDVVKRLAAS